MENPLLKDRISVNVVDTEFFGSFEETAEPDNNYDNDENRIIRRTNTGTVAVTLVPFRFDLVIVTVEGKNRRRNLMFTWANGSWKRNLNQQSILVMNTKKENNSTQTEGLQYQRLDAILENHMNEYFEQELKRTQPIYMPFERIVLNREDANRRLKGDSSSSSLRKVSTSRELNVLERRSETFRYGGTCFFLRDGDLPEPKSNLVHSLQIRAFEEKKNDLLTVLNSDKDLNLQADKRISSLQIEMMGKTNNDNNNVPTNIPTSQTNNGSKSLDTVILIAIVVAALSMFLLAFALYLAFKRREATYGSKQSPAKTSSIQGVISYDKSGNTPNTSNQVMTTPNIGAPTQVIDTHPIIDDNISDYTESIVTDVEAIKAQEKANHIRQKKLSRNPIQQKNTEPSAAIQISSRFNPRYVNKMDNANNSMSPVSMNTMNTPQDETNNNYSHGVQKHITQTRNNQLQQRISNSTADNNTTDGLSFVTKDDHSLSSMESYGYSLDGIGDYSTVGGGSTKYGY